MLDSMHGMTIRSSHWDAVRHRRGTKEESRPNADASYDDSRSAHRMGAFNLSLFSTDD